MSQKIFEALSSSARREMLMYLSESSLTSGEVAARFKFSRPAISKHLSILENAGLVSSEKRGAFVHYDLIRPPLLEALENFVTAFRHTPT